MLEKHLSVVAKEGADFINLPALKQFASYAWLWHDVGKADRELQPHIPTPKASPLLGYLAVGLIHAVEGL